MKNQSILLFGKKGQVGMELQHTLSPFGELYCFGSDQVDVTSLSQLAALIRKIKPIIIVNASGYTSVDQAETNSKKAFLVNASAPAVMAEEAHAIRAVLIHYSTDYVFDGKKGSPYFEEDAVEPINVYGQSKLAGENNIKKIGGAYIILRTSWVYSLLKSTSFVSKILALSRTQEVMRIVTDQIGSPTWARMLAENTSAMIALGQNTFYDYFLEHAGLYHLGGEGMVSRYDFAREVLRLDSRIWEQTIQKIEPATMFDFPNLVRRPQCTPLDCSLFKRVFNLRLPDWHESLRFAMQEDFV